MLDKIFSPRGILLLFAFLMTTGIGGELFLLRVYNGLVITPEVMFIYFIGPMSPIVMSTMVSNGEVGSLQGDPIMRRFHITCLAILVMGIPLVFGSMTFAMFYNGEVL